MEQTLKSLNAFWAEVMQVWQEGLLGIDIGQIVTAIAIFIGFMLMRGLFTKYILNKIHGWTSGTRTIIDDRIVQALIPPIRFIPIVMGVFFAAQYVNIEEHFPNFFPRFMRSLIAFNIFWAMYRATQPLSYGFRPLESLLTPVMANWLFRMMRVLLVFLGGAVILEVWGIQVAPLLAGLGLFGAAVALGAQDLFKNLIGGVTVIAEKRFEPGDYILVDGVVEGIVERINFRSTLVRRFDKAPVHVPNAALSDAVVTNFSKRTHRRILWNIGVTYSTTTAQLKTIRDAIHKHIEENEAFDKSETIPFAVRIDNFADSAIIIYVMTYTKTTDWLEYLQVKEDFAYVVKDIVENKGKASFAFPSQSLYVESLPEDSAELFTPPKGKKNK